MNVNEYDWTDSDLEEIHIAYNCANLLIWNDNLQRMMRVECVNLAGITNLCICDDTIIQSLELKSTESTDNDFLRNLYAAYDINYVYGGRALRAGLKELSITLINGITFSVYAVEFHVYEQ